MEIKKLLIANRGEIACRIIRTAREMGIKTVAVYSEADKESLHWQLADEAYCIGPAEPLLSYLNIEKIIEATKKSSAQAIHPGYGFLSENHKFIERCENEDIIFVGPNSKASKLSGDKLEARRIAKELGIPTPEGMVSKALSLQELLNNARKIGFPLLIKAAMGGGGKGMKIVHDASQLEQAIRSAAHEATTAFGDDTLYIEKFLPEPKHIEVQVISDNYGNAVHLFERECSIQRRYQKIIEEAPSPAVDDELRKKITESALKLIKKVGYNNAGTVEFLVDKDRNFYFLEINARIQVEHPVTEMIIGIDIVKHQLLIAQGEKLRLKQEDIKARGSAIEARIYAEDPLKNFIPSPGKIIYINIPSIPAVRIDHCLHQDLIVSPYYDPILAKAIAFAETREFARKKLIETLKEFVILGINHNIPYLIKCLQHNDFVSGKMTTNFANIISDEFRKWHDEQKIVETALMVASIQKGEKKTEKFSVSKKTVYSPWQTIGKWQMGE